MVESGTIVVGVRRVVFSVVVVVVVPRLRSSLEAQLVKLRRLTDAKMARADWCIVLFVGDCEVVFMAPKLGARAPLKPWVLIPP